MAEVHPKTRPEAVAEIQDAIWRDKVLRARAMSPGERCSDVFELTGFQFEMMLSGALHRIESDDRAEGWKEVRRGLERLQRARDRGFYTTVPASR